MFSPAGHKGRRRSLSVDWAPRRTPSPLSSTSTTSRRRSFFVFSSLHSLSSPFPPLLTLFQHNGCHHRLRPRRRYPGQRGAQPHLLHLLELRRRLSGRRASLSLSLLLSPSFRRLANVPPSLPLSSSSASSLRRPVVLVVVFFFLSSSPRRRFSLVLSPDLPPLSPPSDAPPSSRLLVDLSSLSPPR